MTVLCQRFSALIFLSFIAVGSQAASLCFTHAETYNEQIYCELKAKGLARSLPRFYDFQKNTEQMQSLLLLPLTRKAGINYKAPKVLPKNLAASVGRTPSQKQVASVASSDCLVDKHHIRCGDQQYAWQGNQSRQQLRAGALESGNNMHLPEYQPNQNTEDYLLRAYEHYLLKMLDIGMGGETLNYGKFEYLYYQLKQQGVSFTGRFEKMYYDLKRERQTIAMTSQRDIGITLAIEDCYPLQSLWVCSKPGNQWLFIADK